MEVRTPKVYLGNIRDAINRIEKYMQGVGKSEFLAEDSIAAAAVVREFEIIGEAISQMSDEFRNKHETIPWRIIVDMRNRLIHGYFSVDYDIVWNAAYENLPKLKEQIAELIKEIE